MKRSVKWFGLVVVAVLSASHVFADVKTREKTTMKFEGFIGGIMNRMFGGGDGLTSTVAVKGNRMSTINDTNGQIIDLSEEKIYLLDVKRKEYKAVTFAEMRKQMEEAKKALQQQSQSMNPEDKQAVQDAGKQIEFDADVKETEERKSVAGQEARRVILTITMREKGKTLEEGGGLVLTNDMWLAPKVPAMEELQAFDVKYFKAVFDRHLHRHGCLAGECRHGVPPGLRGSGRTDGGGNQEAAGHGRHEHDDHRGRQERRADESRGEAATVERRRGDQRRARRPPDARTRRLGATAHESLHLDARAALGRDDRLGCRSRHSRRIQGKEVNWFLVELSSWLSIRSVSRVASS